MVQGMHASLAVFHPFSDVMRLVGGKWSLGSPGPWGTRRVRLDGSGGRRLLLRVVDEPVPRTRGHRWHIQLFEMESAAAIGNPLADAEVILEAQTTGTCLLRLSGRHRADADRHDMNACARSLLDQLDHSVSTRIRRPAPAPQAG